MFWLYTSSNESMGGSAKGFVREAINEPLNSAMNKNPKNKKAAMRILF